MDRAPLDRSALLPVRDGLDDPAERRAAGRMTGLLWIIGGVSGALWYLVPGAYIEHWQLGLTNCAFSIALGVACILAPWRRLGPGWIYAAAGVSLLVIPIVMAVNGGADSPTVLYLFLASVLFGYYLPTRLAIAFLAAGMLVPATPMLYDADAQKAIFVAEYFLTAPIYAGVGLTVVLAKRQLVLWHNQSREQALHDPLTGLPNRRALTNALREAAVDPRSARPLALVMIDLDDFKLANTLYGYVGGDRVLCRAADVLRGITRREDLVARVGGDEFAMLVYGSSERDLEMLAQRIVDEMRDAKLDLEHSDYRLTASVGFAVLTEHGEEVDDLLGSADRKLRRAKNAGKDRWDAAGVAELSQAS